MSVHVRGSRGGLFAREGGGVDTGVSVGVVVGDAVGAGVIAGLDHVNRGGDAGGGPSVVLVGPVRSRPSRLSCAWPSSSRPGGCLQLASIFRGFSRHAGSRVS